MRAATLVLLSSLAASGLVAVACSEHFPVANSSGGFDAADDAGGDSGPAPLEPTPPAVIDPSLRKDSTSSPVVWDAVRGGAWTANGDVGSVSFADVEQGKVVVEIPAGKDIRSVALSPDGAWVAAVDRAGGGVALIDANAGVVRRTIAVGSHPRAAVWDAANPRWLYVAVEDTNAVAVVDRTLGVLAETIAVGRDPSGVAVSRQRNELYVTHRFDAKVTIVPLDAATDGGTPASAFDATTPDLRRVPFIVEAAAAEGGSDDASLVGDASLAGDASTLDGASAPDSGASANNDAGPEGGTDDDAGPAPPALTGPIDVPLAYEQGDGTATTPHGTPFAFESLAWAADGNVAWLPHELLANTHPFQFQTTLFPSVSVVDLYQRAEVQTDPNDPNGYIAGRKNLFAAINILDGTGNTSILSQPCGAVLHPNAVSGYVVACGSEDLLTFDLVQGIAVDLLRNLPGDHPVGMAMDDTGQRLFVLDDQSADPPDGGAPLHSKSLTVIDIAGGSLIAHAKVIGTPIPLVAADPVDPGLRAGLRTFESANSAKGTLATTGNFWMSCNGCHLDGFVTTNKAFFNDMFPVDPTKDARIGHTGLRDFFSRSPAANDPSDPPLDPHDALVAFEEMGGLAPDRTGASRTGQVDPSAPTTDATALGTQVAQIITRDLPLGPTWLLPEGGKLDAAYLGYDTAWCGNCHSAEYAAWQKSAHAHAEVDPMVHFCAGVEATSNGAQYTRLCAGCHAPVSSRAGDTSLSTGRGVTCLGCHDTERVIAAGGNGDSQPNVHTWTTSHVARASAGLVTLRDPKFCGTCHQQFVPGTGMIAISTLQEYQAGPYGGGDGGVATQRCVDCHVPVAATGVADHEMIGGNVYLASEIVDASDMAAAELAKLQSALALEATREADAVFVEVKNIGSGHAFPTGVSDIREPWVELQAVDASKNVVARYGGPSADGTLPETAARFGMDIAEPDGGVLFLHELSKSTRIPFARFVPAGGSSVVTLDAPTTLPAGAVELDAVLIYRNVKTQFFRAATGSATATAPEVEVARVVVPN